MLTLALRLALGPGQPLQGFLGGALKGLVQQAVLQHSPALNRWIRSEGGHAQPRFALIPPPPALPGQSTDTLDMGVTLFAPIDQHWLAVCQAIQQQGAQRLNGRPVQVQRITALVPGEPPYALLHDGQWSGDAVAAVGKALAAGIAVAWGQARPGAAAHLHRLVLRTPLLLASRSEVRLGMPRHGDIRPPSLHRVLAALAERLHTMEPTLAAAIGLPPEWQPTGIDAPALALGDGLPQQVQWHYRTSHHAVPVPGLIGNLHFRVAPDRMTSTLLDIGQWLGMGQKTTFGFGNYVYQCEEIRA